MDWHRRYLQQAKWTRDLRAYLFKQAGLNEGSRVHRTASLVLEVGCGTGAILSELPDQTSLHGLDIDPVALAQCHVHVPQAILVQGDAPQLPYLSKTFDIVYCHFLLLWVPDPLQALVEMKRVAKTGGHILAFAEPDYTARLDEPRELVPLGQWQAESLRRQGADPGLGRRLADLFFRAGIELVETGTIKGTEREPSAEDWETEWAVLESDLSGFIPRDQIQEMKDIDQRARAQEIRVLNVPTYFGWGRA
jgi:ubiquinone/menaquinone biosynthesis C-methylase UbiE